MCIFYAFLCSFSYRGKVIIKGVSNIIGIGYSITIIKGQYSWYIGCYSFQRNKGFDSFPCVLDIIPISFTNVNRLIIDHLNTSSLRDQFDILKLLVKKSLDIFMTSETDLDETFHESQFFKDGFTNLWPIYGAIWKADSRCMVCKTYIFIRCNLLSYKN